MATMLVDRDQTRRDAAQTELINKGHVVTALADSDAALETLRLGGWDLLIATDPALIEAVAADPAFECMSFFGDPTGELMDLIAKGEPVPAT